MRIYLDTSVYNRPFDDQSQPRIWLESLALSVILQLIEVHEVELVVSSVVAYENSRNPFIERREWVEHLIGMAPIYQSASSEVHDRAATLAKQGLSTLDALHIASAEAAGSVYFITVDDRLIRNYRRLTNQKMTVVDPATFIREVAGQEVE